ncbi:MAG: hypothetical protein ABIK96_03910 [bacterium]
MSHLAFLPPAWTVAESALVGMLFWPRRHWPPLATGGDRLLEVLLHRRAGLLLAPAFIGGMTYLFRTRTHFLGDGYLLLEILSRDDKIRLAGSLGYPLIQLAARAFGDGPDGALHAFRAVSIFAGMAGTLLVLILLRRTTWDSRRRLLFLILHLTCGTTLLYCGYVENYALLFTVLSAFTLAGVLHLQDRAPLILPAWLAALGIACHLSGLLVLPSLAVLALTGPRRNGWRNLFRAFFPAAVVMLAVAAVFLARGGGWEAVVQEFRADLNLQSPLRPLTGRRGILGWRTWLDLANLLVLIAPVPLVILAGATRREPNRSRTAPAFLVTAFAVLATAFLIIEPKLGAARDWDLFAAQGACLAALAAAVAPVERLSLARVLAAGLVIAVPWLGLNAGEAASASRFAAVARGFAPYPQAYAYEGLGMYHRDRDEPEAAAAMYRSAVAVAPGNARFHALLGAAYVTLFNRSREDGRPDEHFMTLAEASYREAHRINPVYPAVIDNLARLVIRRDGFRETAELLEDLDRLVPLRPDQLRMLVFSRHRLGDEAGAKEAYRRMLVLDPGAEVPVEWLQGGEE